MLGLSLYYCTTFILSYISSLYVVNWLDLNQIELIQLKPNITCNQIYSNVKSSHSIWTSTEKYTDILCFPISRSEVDVLFMTQYLNGFILFINKHLKRTLLHCLIHSLSVSVLNTHTYTIILVATVSGDPMLRFLILFFTVYLILPNKMYIFVNNDLFWPIKKTVSI